MKSESQHDPSQRPIPQAPQAALAVLVGLLLLTTGILVVISLFKSDGDEASSPALPDLSDREAPDRPRALEMEAEAELQPGDERTQDGFDPARVAIVNCRQAATDEALPGVHLYLAAEAIAGASDAQGELEVDPPTTGALTLWAEGWLPVAVRGEDLPAAVAFEAASASLELRFSNATSEHRLLRSVLQPHSATNSEGPWAPVLVERTLDTWIADRVPPGRYDLFVWVVFPDGEPRPFSQRAVEVGAEGPTRVSIDLAAPRDPDELESDS